MAVTMADITKLRKMSGAGMMDCKKALTESDGDIEKAMEIIRKKGQAIAAKRSDRDAAEGCVLAKKDGEFAAIIALKCETDFVAKNEDFVALAQAILDAAVANKCKTLDEVKALPMGKGTVQDAVTDRSGITGEKMELDGYNVVEGAYTTVYNHMGKNQLCTIAAFNKESEEAAHNIAMQIAAMNPAYLDKSDVDQATLDKEKEIQLAQMANDPKMAAKPEKVKEGIVMGKLGKYFEENCLLQQAFVKENKTSVEKHVAEVAKQLGGKITVKAFTRFATGEGIEKKEDDFAAEVASMIK